MNEEFHMLQFDGPISREMAESKRGNTILGSGYANMWSIVQEDSDIATYTLRFLISRVLPLLSIARLCTTIL